MTRSLINRLHLKHILYSHCTTKNGSLKNELSVLKEIIADLINMKVKYDEEDLRVDFVMFIARFI